MLLTGDPVGAPAPRLRAGQRVVESSGALDATRSELSPAVAANGPLAVRVASRSPSPRRTGPLRRRLARAHGALAKRRLPLADAAEGRHRVRREAAAGVDGEVSVRACPDERRLSLPAASCSSGAVHDSRDDAWAALATAEHLKS